MHTRKCRSFRHINIILNYKYHSQLHNPLAPIDLYVHVNSIWPAANALFICAVKSETSPISLSVSLHRSGGEGGGNFSVSDTGGGAVWTGGLLVSVCGLELGWHHEEQPRLRSHRMSVPTQIKREKERKREGEKRANVSNLMHVMRGSLSVLANEYVVALHRCCPW